MEVAERGVALPEDDGLQLQPPGQLQPPSLAAGQTAAFFALVMSVWVVLSPTVMQYSTDIAGAGRVATVCGSFLGLLLGVLAFARLRVPLFTWRIAIALVLGGVLMAVLPLATVGPRPPAELRREWWNITVSGCVITVLAAVSLTRLVRARREWLRRS